MLSTLHPLPKMAICMLFVAASIVVFDARMQAAIIILTALLLTVLERRSPLMVFGLMVPFALFGFGFLTTSLLFRQESDFALKMAQEAPLGSQALSAGVVLFLRAIACGMASAIFALTTDPGAFVKSLMVNLRLAPRVGYALFSALQLVPDLAREAQQIRLARAMRAGRLPRRIPGPVEAFSLLIPLLAYAIRRANRAAIAMEARGLKKNAPRTIIGAPAFQLRDLVFTLTGLGILALLIAWVY